MLRKLVAISWAFLKVKTVGSHLSVPESGRSEAREGTMRFETFVFVLDDFKLSGSCRFLRFVLKIGVFSTVFVSMRI